MSDGRKGGGRGGHKGGSGQKRAPILDLEKYIDQSLHIKYHGGREVIGTLKGFDPLQNLVLDDTEELLRDPEDESIITNKKRPLGLVVCRGPSIVSIFPVAGTQSIPNPFE